MDPNALTQALVAALDASNGSQLTAADIAKTNTFSSINNSANRAGTLYSTAPATQQTKYVGQTYTPTVASIGADTLSKKLSAFSTLQATQHQIDSQNKAASILNGLNFDQYGVIV